MRGGREAGIDGEDAGSWPLPATRWNADVTLMEMVEPADSLRVCAMGLSSRTVSGEELWRRLWRRQRFDDLAFQARWAYRGARGHSKKGASKNLRDSHATITQRGPSKQQTCEGHEIQSQEYALEMCRTVVSYASKISRWER